MGAIDKRVMNLDQLPLEPFTRGTTFASRSVRIGPLLGARDLGEGGLRHITRATDARDCWDGEPGT